jgi:pre-mRNA-splicing factor 38A
MANRTDPLISSVSGSDPQNLLEYITRQKIYDSRFWKEECFGLTVADVLEKSTSLQCIGALPAHFLALCLKLLQLHPETELVTETFVDQEDFKYTRVLGCLYLRLTGRPTEIYERLEPLYRDRRKLRVWTPPCWGLKHVDDFIHECLTEPRILNLSLPRLPSRRSLQEAGYLEEGPRPTALKDVLMEYGGPIAYLKHKALVENNPLAMELWERRRAKGGQGEMVQPTEELPHMEENEAGTVREGRKEKRPKKKQRNYDNLFKKSSGTNASVSSAAPFAASGPVGEGSDEYWNAQRAKLGLKPLKE